MELLSPEKIAELYDEWQREVGAYYEALRMEGLDFERPESWDERLLKAQLSQPSKEE